jgi:hypothetical protein
MDLSYYSLILFLITTVVYFYYIKLPLTRITGIRDINIYPNDTNNTIPLEAQQESVIDENASFASGTPINQIGGSPEDPGIYGSYADYMTSNMSRLLIFFGIVILQQFGINLATVVNKCGGTVGKNIVVSLLMTVIPWTLIFGAVIAMLIVFPGFKSAFADVVGYFAVSGDANDILSTLIIDANIDDAIIKAKGKDSAEMKKAAEAIMKLCGNKGILINTMNPENYDDIWNVLKPLMTENISDADKLKYKDELFKLIVKKDNIGEGMWYVYTGILLTSIVSYNLTTRACVKDLDKMKAEHDKYLEQVKAINEAKAKNMEGEPYTM